MACRNFLLVLLTASIAAPAVAQIPEKILIPVWSERESAGAFGSRWVTELSVMSKGAAQKERLRFPENAADSSFSMGYVERIFLRDAAFRLGERLRVEVQPGLEGMRLWAFLTITNNVTQQVTIVSPQSS